MKIFVNGFRTIFKNSSQDSFDVLIDSLDANSYEDARIDSSGLAPELFDFDSDMSDRRRRSSDQPVLIKQIYQLAEYFKKMQHKNRELKRAVEAISNNIPVLETDIFGLNEKILASDAKILQNQKQLSSNLENFNNQVATITEHDRKLSKYHQRQLESERKFSIISNNTDAILKLNDEFSDYQSTIRQRFESVSEKIRTLYSQVKKNDENVDTRLLLIDSGLRFFNDSVYKEQESFKVKNRNLISLDFYY